jgi:hypothetical protein
VLKLLRVEQPQNRFVERDAGGDEDGEDDGIAGPALGAAAPKQEGGPDGERGQGVAAVVDQVGEQRDAAREDEDERLRGGGAAEHAEADEDRANAGAGAQNRAIHEPVRVTVRAVGAVVMCVLVPSPARPQDAVAQDASAIRSE